MARVAEIRRDLVREAVGVLSSLSADAARVLGRLMQPSLEPVGEDDDRVPPHVRHAAARSILEMGPKLRQELDLDERVRRLEEALKGPPTQPEESQEQMPEPDQPTGEGSEGSDAG